MHGHWCGFRIGVKRVEFYADADRDQAKVITKGASTGPDVRVLADSMEKKFRAVRFSTGFAPVIHRLSTAARFLTASRTSHDR
jgi:hypothetical protein